MNQEHPANPRPTVQPSRIGQFYGLDQCPAYLAHEYDPELIENTSVDEVSLSPLLEATGNEYEQDQLEALLHAHVYSVGPTDHELAARFDETWSGDIERDMLRLRELVTGLAGSPDDRPLLFHEAPVREQIKAWTVEGSVDALLAVPPKLG